jgi:uncharacterized membrane protein YgcG
VKSRNKKKFFFVLFFGILQARLSNKFNIIIMKKIALSLLILLACLFSVSSFSQTGKEKEEEPEALGLPGDNLNLSVVLEVFKKSKTLEEFENTLNSKDSQINNLDLNDDKKVDYIRVNSEKDGDAHLIVLSIDVSEKETQDVAVISVVKDEKGNISFQIIGDEELYGEDYIIEPDDAKSISGGTPNPGYTGGNVIINNNTTNNITNTTTTTNNENNNVGNPNVGFAMAPFLFSPMFVPWRSPWIWGFPPPFWSPWPPVFFASYWGFHMRMGMGMGFHRGVVVINPRFNRMGGRNTSVIVVNNRRNGTFNRTYNGRTYNRPNAPNRPNNNGNRPNVNNNNNNRRNNNNGNRPNVNNNNRPNNNGNRPNVNNTNRPNNNGNRPNINNNDRSNNINRPNGGGSNNRPNAGNGNTSTPARPSTPSARPSTPSARPSTPTARPSSPQSRPSSPQSRPSSPQSRPSSPQSRPSSPQSRPSGGGGSSRGGGGGGGSRGGGGRR